LRKGVRLVRKTVSSLMLLLLIVSMLAVASKIARADFPPAGIVYSVPITLFNTQLVATSTPFQQMIAVDSTAYMSYEAPDLQNVEFFNSNGAIIPSWLESGNTNTATNTVYWLNIATGIPALSNVTLYMGFASTSTNLFNAQTTGEAPELSPVYGEYDTGSFVFPTLYQNFAGSNVPSGWNATGPIMTNNQLQVPGSSFCYVQTSSNYGLDPSRVLDFYGSANTASASDTSMIGGGYSISPPTGYGVVGFGFNGALGGAGTGDVVTSTNGSIAGNIAYLTDGTNEVLTVYASSSSSSSFQNNYIQTDTIPAGLSSPSPVMFFSGGGDNSGTLTVYWVRLRSYPPNGLMPAVSVNGQPIIVLYPACLNDLSVTINGTAEPTTYGATITSITWQWGDGQSSSGGFPQTYTYAQSGTYTINVTAIDSNGLAASAYVSVTFTPPPPGPGQIGATAGPINISVPSGGQENWDWYVFNAGESPLNFSIGSVLLSDISDGSVPPTLTITPTSGTLLPRQQITINIIAIVPCYPSEVGSAWNFAVAAIGESQSSAGGGVIFNSGVRISFPVVVLPPLLEPASVDLDFGQSQILSLGPDAFMSSNSYQWYLNGSTVADANDTAYTFAPPSPGLNSFYVVVTDNDSIQAVSNTANVTVNPSLSVSISPLTSNLEVGVDVNGEAMSLTFNSSIIGGTSPYSYQWYLNGSPTGGEWPTYCFEPSSPGFYSVNVAINDSAGAQIMSDTANVTVIAGPSVTISPTSPTINIDQSQTFTCNVSCGTPPYYYELSSGRHNNWWAWYLNVTPNGLDTQLGSGQACTFVPSKELPYGAELPAYFAVTVGIIDSAGVFVYNSTTIMVNPLPPTVSISPASINLDFGQSQTFNSTVSGGTSPYSFQWYLDGVPISGATDATWVFTPTSTGFYTVQVNVTDSVGVQVASNTAPVTVNALPSVSISPISVTLTGEQPQLFNSSVSDGTGPYSYQWYFNGDAVSNATSSTWTFTPKLPGSDTICVVATDSLGVQATSIPANVTVNGQFAFGEIGGSIFNMWESSSTPQNISIGGQATGSWGLLNQGDFTMDYTIYIEARTSIAGTEMPIVTIAQMDGTIAPNSVLYLPVTVSVPDYPSDIGNTWDWYLQAVAQPLSSSSSGVIIQLGTVKILVVTVTSLPSVSVSPASVIVDVGQSELYTSNVSGGTSPYSFQWYLNGALVSGATDATWTFTPNSSGSYTVYLNVTDSLGEIAISNTATVNVNSPLSVSVLPSSVTMDVGQSQTFNSTVSGGTLPYSYQWCLNGSAVPSANFSWAFTPTSAGWYTIYANVTDSVGVQATSNNANVTVNIGTHDVAVTNVASSKTVVGQGFNANITVTVADQGNYTETFNVTAYANTTSVASQNVTLASGTSTTLTFTWNTTGFAYGNYTLSAYAWPVPGETNTANNNCTGGWVIVSIPCDITGPKGWPDGTVNMRDIALVARAFGSMPGSSNWNPNADFNNDGRIDMKDIALIARHFGSTDP
jgi:hypothetical protein